MPAHARVARATDVTERAFPIVLHLADEAATQALAAMLAAELRPGDLIALSGEIGAGKTTLARAILRILLRDPDLEAPSPTFTLVQTYEREEGPIVHADLYRIAGGGELVELGFEEMQPVSIMLVEWPERAPEQLGPFRLDVRLELEAVTGGRRATLTGQGPLAERVARAQAEVTLIEAAGWGSARRILMQGDASTRAYERLEQPSGETAILMISPPRPDGPPVRRGRPYSAIARLAESVHAFAAMGRGLLDQGFSAPRILAEDLETGLLLLEDLGSAGVVDENGPVPERYAEATRLLAQLHARQLPHDLPLGGAIYAIPPYDLDAFLIEVELLLDWYMPFVGGTKPSGSVRAEFGHVWRDTLADVLAGPQTWTLRDYHSPNLIWLPERDGVRRIGVLDFQDAVIGPPAYDVASLVQDARVTVPAELELKLLGLYAAERKAADPSFDMAAFAAAYSIMGAQRATKILGIFARLDRRDGKPQYLAHLPRIRAYLARNLAHPALFRLRAWFAYNAGDLAPPDEVQGRDARIPDPPAPVEHAGREAGAQADADIGEPAAEGPDGSIPVQTMPVEAEPETAPDPERAPAMVLAAGLGTRMRPITDTRPKPLVEVGGRTMLDHALGRLAEAGIERAVVNVHYLPEMIEGHLAGVSGLAIAVSDERGALLETGGGIKRALPLLESEFLVLNSDSLWTEHGVSNLRQLFGTWQPGTMDILLLLAPRESLGYDGRGDFHLGDDGRLARRRPEELAPLVYAGAAILKAELFDDTPEGAFSLNLLFDRAIEAGRLYGAVLDGDWLHVGTPEAIAPAEERLAAAALAGVAPLPPGGPGI